MRVHLVSVLSVLVTVLVIPAFSCEKRPFSEPQGPSAQVRIQVDWSLCRETPQGMTVIIYSAKGKAVRSQVTAETGGISLRLPPGTYRSAVFSYSVPEWKSLDISGLDSWEQAVATAGDTEPSILSCGSGSLFTVTERDALEGTVVTPPVLYPAEIVHKIHITVLVEGLRHLKAVSGSLSPQIRQYPLYRPQPPEMERERPFPLPSEAWFSDTAIHAERHFLGVEPVFSEIHLTLTERNGKTVADTVIGIRDRLIPTDKGDCLLTLGDRPEERFRLKGGGFSAEIDGWEQGGETEFILH